MNKRPPKRPVLSCPAQLSCLQTQGCGFLYGFTPCDIWSSSFPAACGFSSFWSGLLKRCPKYDSLRLQSSALHSSNRKISLQLEGVRLRTQLPPHPSPFEGRIWPRGVGHGNSPFLAPEKGSYDETGNHSHVQRGGKPPWKNVRWTRGCLNPSAITGSD